MISLPLLLLAMIAADEKPVPKVPVGKDTTFVLGPLNADGYIDFEAALNERLGRGITPETNANVLIWKALGPRPEGGNGMPAEFFKLLGINEPALAGDYLLSDFDYLKKQGLEREEIARLQSEDFEQARRRPWTAKEFPHVAAWLVANEKPMATLIEASQRPEYFNPLVSHRNENRPSMLLAVLLPGVQRCRMAASALAVRAMLRVSEGKTEAAWQDLLACHRLGRLVARGGTLIEFLVGVAIDTIASQGEIAFLDRVGGTAQQVRGWLRDLQSLPPMPRMADKIDLAERLLYLEVIQLARRGGPGVLAGVETGKAPPFQPDQEAAMARVDWETPLREGNRWYDRLRDALRLKSRPERTQAAARVMMDFKAIKPRGDLRTELLHAEIHKSGSAQKVLGKILGEILLGMLLPATHRVQDAGDRAEQTQRNQHCAFALAAYQREKGRYPEKLDALVPAFLADVPDDLFSGNVVIYRPEGKGFHLYSIGVNNIDEGGRGSSAEPRGDDLGVQIPVPAKK